MITQKIDFYNRAGTTQTAAKGSGQSSLSFGDVMSQNTGPSSRKENTIKSKESNRKTENTSKKDSVFQRNNATNLKAKNIASSEKNTVKESGSTEEIPTEKMEEAMMQMQNMIVDTVTKTLNISEEELNAALNELNLSVLDLMDSANAAKLLMNLHNVSDPMQLLTDESLTSQLDALQDALENLQLSKEIGINKEDVRKHFEQMPQEEKFETVVNNVVDKTTSSDEKENPLDDISIIVEKETTTSTASKDGTADFAKDSHNARQESRQDREAAPMETFVGNLAAKGQSSDLTVEAVAQKVETMRSIVEQVVKQIKVAIKPEATSMELQLNPQNLGKINLVVASRDGQLTATITTQNEMAKEALQSQLQMLRESLDSQGLKVEAVEVTVSEFAFHSNQGEHTRGDEKHAKSNNRRKLDLGSFDETAESATEEDILAAKILKDNGGSVDYSA